MIKKSALISLKCVYLTRVFPKKKKKMKQKQIRWKGETDKFTTVVEDFNTVLSATDWSSGRKSGYILSGKHSP